MWKTTFFFPSTRNCNSEFYHFLAVSSGNCFRSHCCAVFTELIVGFLIFFLSARLCSVHLFVPGFSVLFFFFECSLWYVLCHRFSICHFLTLESNLLEFQFCVTNSSSFCSLLSEEWRAGTSATLLRRRTPVSHWIKQQRLLGNSLGRVKSILLVLATTRISLLRTIFLFFCFGGVASLPSGPTGSDYPGGFSTAEE